MHTHVANSATPRPLFWTNVVFLIAQNVLSPFVAMVLVVAISRRLGAGVLGQYTLVMAFFAFGEAFASLGLNVFITRHVAKHPGEVGRCLANAGAVASAALVAGLTVAVPIFFLVMPDGDIRPNVLLLMAALPASIVVTFAQAALLGLDHARDLVVVDLAEGLARAALATVVVVAGGGLTGIVLVVVMVRTLSAAAYVWRLHRRGTRFEFTIEKRFCKGIARESLVLGTIPIVNALYARLDLFLLGHFRGVADVGYYNAAGKFQDAVRPVPRGYVRAVYPALSRADQFSRDALLEESRRALLLVLGCLIPIAVVLAGVAEPLTLAVFGGEFQSAVAPAALFGWLVVPYGMSVLLAHVLFATGNQAFDLRVNVAALCASAAINALAIPRWGGTGAAAAALLVTTAYSFAEYWYVKKRVGDLRAGLEIGKMCLAGAAAYWVIDVVRARNVAAAVGAGLIVYAAGLILTGVIRRGTIVPAALGPSKQLAAQTTTE